MIRLKTEAEIEILKENALLVSKTLAEVGKAIAPGVTTKRLDEIAETYIRDHGAVPGFLNYYGDSAYTFPVGNIDPETARLLQVTKESLYLGAAKAIAGNRIGDIGSTIQRYTEGHGFSVVREMVGHGVGRNLHESPEVPNYGKAGQGKKLVEGMVICIEPMINAGRKEIFLADNGWAVSTADGKNSAHFEFMVVVRREAPEVLTTYEYIENK